MYTSSKNFIGRQFLTRGAQSPRDVLAQNVQPLPWDDSPTCAYPQLWGEEYMHVGLPTFNYPPPPPLTESALASHLTHPRTPRRAYRRLTRNLLCRMALQLTGVGRRVHPCRPVREA